jgi:hypothetical protein
MVCRIFLLALCTFCFVQCASTQVDSVPPVQVLGAYIQSWGAEARGEGAETSVIVTVSESIALDSMYYNGKIAKLSPLLNPFAYEYVARFSSKINGPNELVMHSDPNKEYGNTVEGISNTFPFQLKPNQAMVSYKKGSQTRYFKIENISHKRPNESPSAPVPSAQ